MTSDQPSTSTKSSSFSGSEMVIGLCISLFLAVTTINEQTLTFVPKAVAVIGILLLLLPWIVRSLIEFTVSVIQKMPQMVQ